MDKLKVGILGLRRGLSHLRNFLNTEEAEVIGAADRIEQWRDRAAGAVGDMGREVNFVGEFEELLELQPDAVAIASNGRLQAALDEIMTKQKRTTVVIAHRLSTIRNADKIAVINEGNVVEQGTHDRLVSQRGAYYELFETQMSEKEKEAAGVGLAPVT